MLPSTKQRIVSFVTSSSVKRIGLNSVLVDGVHIGGSSVGTSRAEGKGQQGKNDNGGKDTGSKTNRQDGCSGTDILCGTRSNSSISGVVDITINNGTVVGSGGVG